MSHTRNMTDFEGRLIAHPRLRFVLVCATYPGTIRAVKLYYQQLVVVAHARGAQPVQKTWIGPQRAGPAYTCRGVTTTPTLKREAKVSPLRQITDPYFTT